MKKLLWIFIAVLGLSFATKAQSKWGEDSVKCRENLYIYYELAKGKNYLEAFDAWNYVYENCPASSKNNFIYGTYIAEAKIKDLNKKLSDITIGMSKSEVTSKIGKPLKINETKTANSTSEQYVYENIYVYFQNNRVTTVQSSTDSNSENPENLLKEREKYVTLLMNVYDDRLKYFPGKEDYVLERKALDMIQHWPDSTERAYDIFKKALELSKEHSAAFYNGYFIAAARLFNSDIFDVNDMFNAYNVVMEGLEYNNNVLNRGIRDVMAKDTTGGATDAEKKEMEKSQRELERYENVVSNVEKILGPIATCSRLESIYNQESFEANKADAVWLRRASTMLTKERKNDEGEMEDCTENPVFFQIAEALYTLEPSISAAKAMGVLSYKKGNYTSAAQYFGEAAKQEIDPKVAAAYYLKVAAANQKSGKLSAAKSAALKAAALNKGWGDPYIVLASIYAQADGLCGNDLFEKKAVYWAAIDKLQYAKSIDAEVAAKANRLIAAFKKQVPDKGISFQLNHAEGEKYTIGCWINETVTAEWN